MLCIKFSNRKEGIKTMYHHQINYITPIERDLTLISKLNSDLIKQLMKRGIHHYDDISS